MFEHIFEDGDELFSGGSPEAKFFEVLRTANQNIVQDILSKTYERMAVLEILLDEQHGEAALDQIVAARMLQDSMQVDEMKKSLMLETVGEIVTRCE